MLQRIRERAHGWFAWTFFSLITLTFIFWGVHNYTDTTTKNVVATINGLEIYQNDLDATYQRLRSQLQFQMGTQAITPAVEKQLKAQALEEMVVSDALSQSARKEGLRYTLEQAAANIRLIPTFQSNGQFSINKFKQILTNFSYTELQFVENLRSAMLINQMRIGFVNSAFALKHETHSFFKLINQRRDIQYVLIPINKLLNEIKITAQEIEKYYQQHQNDFKQEEQVSLNFIELTTTEIKSNLKFTDQEIKEFYDTNTDLFQKNEKTQAFDKAKVNEILKRQKAEQLFAELSEKMANLAFSNPDSLDKAAKDLHLSIQKTNLFSQKGEEKGFLSNPKIISAAYSDDVLKQGNNSALIEINPQHVAILRINQHIPSHVYPLKIVAEKIAEKLKFKKAEELANELSEKILTYLMQEKEVNSLFKQYHLNWVNKNNVGRFDNTIPSRLLAKAFQLPLSIENKMHAAKVVLSTGDYGIVRVNQISENNNQKDINNERIFSNQLENLYGQFDYGLYVDSVFKKAKVKITQ
ncbi:MAG: Peptidyl-prolyl cis-trans isomerase D [Legionellaceae bacterium]